MSTGLWDVLYGVQLIDPAIAQSRSFLNIRLQVIGVDFG